MRNRAGAYACVVLLLCGCGPEDETTQPSIEEQPAPPVEMPTLWQDALKSRNESIVLDGIRRVSDERIQDAALPLVRVMRESPSDMVRSFAADALADLQSVDSLLPLIESLADERRWVRHSASDTLMALTDHDFGFDHTRPIEEAPTAQVRCHAWFVENEAALRERWKQPRGERPQDRLTGVYRVDYEHADEGLLARLIALQRDDLAKMTDEGRAAARKMMQREHDLKFGHWRDTGEPLVLVLMADGRFTLRGSHRAMRILTAAGSWSVRGDTTQLVVTSRHGEAPDEDVVTVSATEPDRVMLKWGKTGFEYRFVRR